jgi:CBS-domain-containing membrane protein
VLIEWIDRIERVTRILPEIDTIAPQALITIEDIRVYRAALRSGGPFGGRAVGEALDTQAVTVAPDGDLRAAVLALIERNAGLLTVLDGDRRVLGQITAERLMQRLNLPARILAALSAPEREAVLGVLAAYTPADLMDRDARTLYVETPADQAVNMLIEWGQEAMPVLDHDGRYTGLFGTDQALQSAVRARTVENGAIRSATPATSVGVVMQSLVPTTTTATRLPGVLDALRHLSGRWLVILHELQPVGYLTDVLICGLLPEAVRAVWVELLRTPNLPLPVALAALEGTIGERPLTPPPLINNRTPVDEAIRQILEHNYHQMVVVDDDGRLAGMITRRGLIRALAQESVR